MPERVLGRRRERSPRAEIDPPQSSAELDVPERDVGDPLGVRETEEAVEVGDTQVEIDERHAPARACLRDGQVRRGRRLSLALDRARDEYRARAFVLEHREIEVRAQHPECLGVGAGWLRQHDEAVVLRERLRRGRDARQERQAEPIADLRGRAHPRVECFDPEGEPEPEDEAQHQAYQSVLAWGRRDLSRTVRLADHVRPGRLQRLERCELLVLVAKADGELRVVQAARREPVELLADLHAGASHGVRVELPPIAREGLRVRGRQAARLAAGWCW